MAEFKISKDLEFKAHYLLQVLSGRYEVRIEERRVVVCCSKRDIEWLAAELLEIYTDGYNDALIGG